MAKAKILIVDDEPHIVEMLRLRLEANDFQVEAAYSGQEALKVMEANQDIDTTMTDIMMPGMNGIELLRNIKGHYPDMEVVVITGFASLDTAIEAVRLGAYDYIKKPFEDIAALIRTVEGAIERRKLVLENRQLTEDLSISNEKLKKINLMLGDNVNELVMLHHIVESISGTVSLDEIVDNFLKNLVESLDFRKSLLFIVDEAQNILELRSSAGIKKETLGSVIVSLEDKSRDAVRALDETQPLYLSGFEKQKDELLTKIIDDKSRTVIYYPLRTRERIIGVLMLESDKEVQVKKLHSLQLYINQAALVMENARMFNRLVKINEELKEMDRLKTEFISTVSHELRTPLTAIKEGVALVLDKIVGEINERQERVLEMSKTDVDRLARLIEDLLNISRIESGKVILDRVKVSLSNLIERSLLPVKAMVGEKKIKIEASLSKGLQDVFVDEDRIVQVIVNLLSNAVKFSPEKSTIKISTNPSSKENFIELNIKDQGIGISKKDRGRLFQKFSQIGRKDGPGAKGTGLGLAISKQLISMHEGKIYLKESESEKGSTFSFTVPIYEKGIEERAMLNDNIDSELKRMQRVKGNFTIVSFKLRTALQKKEICELKEKVKAGLPSEEDKIGLYSDKLILSLLKSANKSSASTWSDNIIKSLPKSIKDKIELHILTYPEDGESREELLKRLKE